MSFSTAASAAGLVSLGIQTLQGLIEYYSAWKDYHEDVVSTLNSLSTQKRILLLILDSIQSDHFHPEIKISVNQSIATCQHEIDTLGRKLAKIKSTPMANHSGGMLDRIQGPAARLSYPFKQSTLMKLRETVAEMRSNLKLALSTLQIDVTVGISGRLQVIEGKLIKATTDITNISNGITILTSLHTEDNQRKIIKWLAPADPSSDFAKNLENRKLGTGHWFLSGENFRVWHRTPNSLIWLHGIPGGGKTVLFSTALEDILHRASTTANTAVAYFYFDFADNTKQIHESLLRSLLVQISSQSTPFPEVLKRLYMSKLEGQNSASCKELLMAFENILRNNAFEHIYIMIDALDECSTTDKLLELLHNIRSWKLEKIHLLVTSRREQAIQHSIMTKAEGLTTVSIGLEEKFVNPDIESYIVDRVAREESLNKWPDVLKLEIQQTLSRDANGMFRWVTCQFDVLNKCYNQRLLRKALSDLPRSLDDTYEHILSRIDSLYSEDAIKILQWISFSYRPLLLDEIAEIIAVDNDAGPPFLPENRLPVSSDVVGIPSSLVTTSKMLVEAEGKMEEKQVLRLAHYSVKEFLVSKRIRESAMSNYAISESLSHKVIAETCLIYLLYLGQAMGPYSNTQMMETYPLARYAALYWPEHARLVLPTDSEISDSYIVDFLCRKQARETWRLLFDPDEGYIQMPAITRRIKHNLGSPLYYACLLNLERTSRTLLDDYADIQEQGGFLGSALHAASDRGHEHLVQLLLQYEADPNLIAGYYGTCMQAAVSGNHLSIIRLLLDSGADINLPGGWYGNTLQAAICTNDQEIIHAILENSLNINQQGGRYANALQAASARGIEGIVEILLQRGADPNAEGGYYGSALQAAAADGQASIVRLLLDAGAYINRKGGYFNTALQAATFSGDRETVELLIKRGADIRDSIQGLWGYDSSAGIAQSRVILEFSIVRKYWTQIGHSDALQAAVLHGKWSIMHTLLTSGADPNSEGGKYGHALQAATVGGNLDTVKDLLYAGADINQTGGYYNSALQAAIAKNSLDMFTFLLENGADPNIEGGSYGNVINTAICWGREDFVIKLLQRGAKPRKQHHYSNETLIDCAVTFFEDSTVLELIKAGVEVRDFDIYECLQRGPTKSSTIRILLENSYDVVAENGRFRNLLHMAVAIGDLDMVELLLDRGALVHHKVSIMGENQLNEAVSADQVEIVKALLRKLPHGAIAHTQTEYRNAKSRWKKIPYAGSVEEQQLVFLPDYRYEDPPLQRAASNGNIEMAGLLIQHGLDVDQLAYKRSTNYDLLSPTSESGQHECDPLSAAAASGHIEMIKFLLANKAHVSQSKSVWKSAILNQQEEILHFLLTVSMSGTNNQDTLDLVLRQAVTGGFGHLAKTIWDRGGRIDFEAGVGQNAVAQSLYFSRTNDDLHEIKSLIAIGAKVTPMAVLIAIKSKKQHILKFLLTIEPDVNFYSADWVGSSCNPLALAVSQEDLPTIQVLLNAGASINFAGKDEPLLRSASAKGHNSVVQLLLKRGAMVNFQEFPTVKPYPGLFTANIPYYDNLARQKASSNALHAAVLGCHADLVKILLDSGADPNIPNQIDDEAHGNINVYCPSPLVAAFQKRQHDIARLLLKKGANLPKHNSGQLIYEAVQQNEYRIVKLLLTNGVQPPKDEKQSDELLMTVAKSGNMRLLRALIKAGAISSTGFDLHGSTEKLMDYLRTRGKELREKELQKHTKWIQSIKAPVTKMRIPSTRELIPLGEARKDYPQVPTYLCVNPSRRNSTS